MRVDSPEAEAAKDMVARRRVKVIRDESVAGLRTLVGVGHDRDVEALLDADGKVVRGQCNCSHYFRFKLRPLLGRHMQGRCGGRPTASSRPAPWSSGIGRSRG
ncbi:MAG: hypothetical protein U0871_25065 [Gemmataceae bacterium]